MPKATLLPRAMDQLLAMATVTVAVAVVIGLAGLGVSALTGSPVMFAAGIDRISASGGGLRDALPEIHNPPPGDPRLEPIPDNAIHLGNVAVFANGKRLLMRFPPRVNGQNQSDGDKNAGMFVLFDGTTGLRIDQPPIVEAVPKNAAGKHAPVVDDLTARMFSAVWQLHAVTLDPSYDPNDPAKLIDSFQKVRSSTLVQDIYQTNIFLNGPVVPLGSTVDEHSLPPMNAFFDGNIVSIVPYEIEDGGFNNQVMFMFTEEKALAEGGKVLNQIPYHLVASFEPGDPFYTPFWEMWNVIVPKDFDVSTLKSAADVKATGFPIVSSGIRINCPVVAIETAAGTGNFKTFPFGTQARFEDAIGMLQNVNRDPITHVGDSFDPIQPFQFDILQGESEFLSPRTHLITDINPTWIADGPGSLTNYPPIDPDGKGNVIPLILENPFPLVERMQDNSGPGNASSGESGPNTSGVIIRFTQKQLDEAFADNDPPRLPEKIEDNFAGFIAKGLLDPKWALGGRPYQDRLALVGRALHELVWTPEQGANQKDVTTCLACHSTPAPGGAARGLYTLERFDPERPEFGPISQLNPGSMYGSGAAELLVIQKKARGEDVTFAHGSKGQIASIRDVVAGARNAHFGIQTTHRISSRNECDLDGDGMTTIAEAAMPSCDPDGDGRFNESTVGEVTAETVFLLSLPVPDQASGEALQVLRVTSASVQQGRRLFTGAGCALCHTPFHPLKDDTLMLSNLETNSLLPIKVSRHFANLEDIRDGLAQFDGQPGLRSFGDFKKHKMGALMFSSGTDNIKTAELWDVGSTFPYLRDGSKGSDLRSAILAHSGVLVSDITVTRAPQVDTPDGHSTSSSQLITIANNSPDPIMASPDKPIRVVVTGMSQDIQVANADGAGPSGGSRQGAFRLITETIPAGGSAAVELVFDNPNGSSLEYDLAIQDHAGYSEGLVSAQAFEDLNSDDQQHILDFLKAQLIEGKTGEGSGGSSGSGFSGIGSTGIGSGGGDSSGSGSSDDDSSGSGSSGSGSSGSGSSGSGSSGSGSSGSGSSGSSSSDDDSSGSGSSGSGSGGHDSSGSGSSGSGSGGGHSSGSGSSGSGSSGSGSGGGDSSGSGSSGSGSGGGHSSGSSSSGSGSGGGGGWWQVAFRFIIKIIIPTGGSATEILVPILALGLVLDQTGRRLINWWPVGGGWRRKRRMRLQ